MNLAGFILRTFGWRVKITIPDFPKCIICVAPHTSNWDFILGKLAYASVGRKAGFLMKSSWFFFPLGLFFRAMGGVPVYRKNKRGSLVEQLIYKFNSTDCLTLAITPEGTRSRTTDWRTGFLRIAYSTGIPVALGKIDYGSKNMIIDTVAKLTGNVEKDMVAVKNYFKDAIGKYPHKFATD